jgi:hypothetical protein
MQELRRHDFSMAGVLSVSMAQLTDVHITSGVQLSH